MVHAYPGNLIGGSQSLVRQRRCSPYFVIEVLLEAVFGEETTTHQVGVASLAVAKLLEAISNSHSPAVLCLWLPLV
jgi:hypothetical protein